MTWKSGEQSTAEDKRRSLVTFMLEGYITRVNFVTKALIELETAYQKVEDNKKSLKPPLL